MESAWGASQFVNRFLVQLHGSLNEKFPRGVEAETARLAAEGDAIEPGKGKKPPRIKDFEKSLQKL